MDPRGRPRCSSGRGLHDPLRPHGRSRPCQGDHHGLPALLRRGGTAVGPRAPRGARASWTAPDAGRHPRPRPLARHRRAILRDDAGRPGRRRRQGRAPRPRRRHALSRQLQGRHESRIRNDQPQQARDRRGPAARRGAQDHPRAGAPRGRDRRKLRARRRRAPGRRLHGDQRDESRDRLRLRERLRPGRSVRAPSRLQHDRDGDERAHGAHRSARRSTDAPRHAWAIAIPT